MNDERKEKDGRERWEKYLAEGHAECHIECIKKNLDWCFCLLDNLAENES